MVKARAASSRPAPPSAESLPKPCAQRGHEERRRQCRGMPDLRTPCEDQNVVAVVGDVGAFLAIVVLAVAVAVAVVVIVVVDARPV